MAAADGATRDHYDRALNRRWSNSLGDWVDATGTPQGAVPYAEAALTDDDVGNVVEWDVTTLVREWAAGTHPNDGLLLRGLTAGGTQVFGSREHFNASGHPVLLVEYSLGQAPAAGAQAPIFLYEKAS